MITDDIDFATYLKELRMSPGELSEEFGLPRSQISRLLVGEEKPDRLTRWALEGLRSHKRDSHRKTDKNPFSSHVPKRPLAEEFADDTWTGETARLALPVLIEVAKKGATITYSQLHDAVVALGGRKEVGKMTKYAFPLGRIGSAMQRLGLPPLTMIVVNGSTGLPSSGVDQFVADYLDLNREARQALAGDVSFRRKCVEELWVKVYARADWSDVMAELGISGDADYDR